MCEMTYLSTELFAPATKELRIQIGFRHCSGLNQALVTMFMEALLQSLTSEMEVYNLQNTFVGFDT